MDYHLEGRESRLFPLIPAYSSQRIGGIGGVPPSAYSQGVWGIKGGGISGALGGAEKRPFPAYFEHGGWRIGGPHPGAPPLRPPA